jgi:hypothetical protein
MVAIAKGSHDRIGVSAADDATLSNIAASMDMNG